MQVKPTPLEMSKRAQNDEMFPLPQNILHAMIMMTQGHVASVMHIVPSEPEMAEPTEGQHPALTKKQP